MNYYQQGLLDCICGQAMGQPDWGPCCTTRDLQAVTLLASKKLDDIVSANQSSFPKVSAPLLMQMIPVPQDACAMEVDVHASRTCLIEPPTS